MAPPSRRVWCACAIIDYLAGKPSAALCKDIIAQAEAGAVEILVSTLAEAEVVKLEGFAHPGAEEMIEEFFDRSYVVRVALDPLVARRARAVVRDYGLKPLDSVHVASAIQQEIEILETYDGDMITKINGQEFDLEDGRKIVLIVRKPVWETPSLPETPFEKLLRESDQQEPDEDVKESAS